MPNLTVRYDNPICRTGLPGYVGWRNRFFCIDSWAFQTFTNTGSDIITPFSFFIFRLIKQIKSDKPIFDYRAVQVICVSL
jgi:hypothetical protein